MEQDEEANYILPPDEEVKVSDAIASYWIERWLSSRLNHAPALEAVRAFIPEQGAVSREFVSVPVTPSLMNE